MEMRIDDLAQQAGVPTRTIRYYTQQGLLPPPRLKGRVGYYNDRHLDRLKLIKELQEKRYLPLAVIKSVVRRFESGADLETMLAPLDMVFAPRWESSAKREFTREELADEAGVDAAVVEAAEDMGLLFPEQRGRERRYTTDDVHMLEVAQSWLDLGLPASLARLYRDSFEEISREQVRAFNACITQPAVHEGLEPEALRERLVDGYRSMSRVFTQLAGQLHRKLLQKAVERYAEANEKSAS